ncbi:hypothetical protein ACHWQZ_G007879 [Mnemiopsis leidyi]
MVNVRKSQEMAILSTSRFLILFWVVTIATGNRWVTAQHGEYIDFDLEATPLQIKTDSAVGSEDQVVVFFFSSHGGRAGGILLYFGPTLQYYIWHCQQGIYSNFLAPLPTATEKEWRVTVTRTSSVRVVIQCQDVEVANVVLSDSTCSCSEEDWRETWSNDVEKIFFTDTDTATDLYLEPVTPDIRPSPASADQPYSKTTRVNAEF